MGKVVASVMLSTVYAGFIIHHSAYLFSKNKAYGKVLRTGLSFFFIEVSCRVVLPCHNYTVLVRSYQDNRRCPYLFVRVGFALGRSLISYFSLLVFA